MDQPPADALDARRPEAHDAGHTWTWMLWVFALIFFIYPLSVGPVAKLYFANAIPRRPVEIFYSPLEAVARRWQPLNSFFQWYIQDVWRARPASAPIVSPPPNARAVEF